MRQHDSKKARHGSGYASTQYNYGQNGQSSAAQYNYDQYGQSSTAFWSSGYPPNSNYPISSQMQNLSLEKRPAKPVAPKFDVEAYAKMLKRLNLPNFKVGVPKITWVFSGWPKKGQGKPSYSNNQQPISTKGKEKAHDVQHVPQVIEHGGSSGSGSGMKMCRKCNKHRREPDSGRGYCRKCR